MRKRRASPRWRRWVSRNRAFLIGRFLIIIRYGKRKATSQRRQAMGLWRVVWLGLAVAFFGISAPATADDFWRGRDHTYWHIRHAIYQRVNRIAWLEANPDVDESVKGPAITTARAEIRHLRAKLGPPLPTRFYVPCCYARRPLYIR
jgi:hypothetical protein